jgi:hypothetical protein
VCGVVWWMSFIRHCAILDDGVGTLFRFLMVLCFWMGGVDVGCC